MTRVLMTADTIGGVWTYACELIGALAPFGIEVTLATMGARLSRDQAQQIAALPNVTVKESDYRLEWMSEPWRDVEAAGQWLLELASRTGADLVHVNGYTHAALPFDVPVVCVAHSCVCTWYRAVRQTEADADWDPYRKRVAAGLRAADAVVAPTEAILRAILATYHVEREGRTIPNGVDSTRWPRGDKEPFILSAGRLWDEAKGLIDLDAVRVTWPICVAGQVKAPDGADITASNVRLLGELAPEALAEWMSRASIYALPARYEPFGLSAVEAALAGCALVLGDIDTLREVWGDTAVYVPPRDPKALGAAIEGLTRDPLRRRALAGASRKRALELTPERMATAYHALYAELLARTQEVCA